MSKTTKLYALFVTVFLLIAAGTADNNWVIGDGQNTDKQVTANVGDGATNPFIWYDASENAWKFSNDGSSSSEFGSGSGSGSRSLELIAGGDFESTSSINGWHEYQASATPPAIADTASSASANLAITQETSDPLSGSGSLNLEWTASASNDGFAYDFTRPSQLGNTSLSIKFDYRFSNAVTTPRVAVIDLTNTAYLYDSGVDRIIGSGGDYGDRAHFSATFRVPRTTASFRLIVHQSSFVGGDRSAIIDNLSISQYVERKYREDGAINYIFNPDAEGGLFGWVAYDSTNNPPVNIADTNEDIANTEIDTPTVFTNYEFSAPIRGNLSFQMNRSNGGGQGEGIATQFTIDPDDQSRVLEVSFRYDINGTTDAFSDGEFDVYIQNACSGSTNEGDTLSFITGPDASNKTHLPIEGIAGTNTYKASFLPESDCLVYRLLIHQSGSDASANSILFDRVYVGPGKGEGTFDGIWKIYDSSDVTITSSTITGGLTDNGSWFRPFKDPDGVWYLEASLNISNSSQTLNDETYTIAGVTFDSNTNHHVSFAYGSSAFVPETGFTNTGASTFRTIASSGVTATTLRAYFTAKLDEKPTWVDFDPLATVYPTVEDASLGDLSTHALTTGDFNNFTGLSLATGAYLNYKKVGSELYVEMGWRVTGTGSSGSEISLDLDDIVGQTITFETGVYGGGVVRRYGASVGDRDPDVGSIVADGTGAIKFSVNTGQTNLTGTNLADSGTDRDQFSIVAMIPVVEWSGDAYVPPVGLLLAKGGLPGLVEVDSDSVDISSSGDFNVLQPEIDIYQSGRRVTISWETLAHTSTDTPSTAAGVIPERFRPAFNVSNVYAFTSSNLREVTVTSGGGLDFEYRDFSGSAASLGTTLSGSITYLLDE